MNFNLIRNKFNRSREQLPYLPRALALAWNASRRWTSVWFILLIAQGLLPVALVYLSRTLINQLVDVMGVGATWSSFQPTLLHVSLMALLMIMTEVLRSAIKFVRTAQAELIDDHITQLVHKQSAEVDLAFYDSAEYFDHLYRARFQASVRPLRLLENLGGLLQNGLTLIAMAAVLIPYGVWLPPVLIISSLPAFSVVIRHQIRLHAWHLRATEVVRRGWYFDSILVDREAAAELRLLNLGNYFQKQYQRIRTWVRAERIDLARDASMAELGAASSALIVTGLTLAWMLWRAIGGAFTFGDLALFYQAFNQGQRQMRTLTENLGQIYSSLLHLGDLFQFLELEPKIVDNTNPVSAPTTLVDGIRFEGVSFRYPHSEQAALVDFNLHVPAGQIAAIVGANGAGKSTLMKLLCRLYDPTDGRILLDGIDLRSMSQEELRRLSTAIFQKPVRYSGSAAENIGLGDLPRWLSLPNGSNGINGQMTNYSSSTMGNAIASSMQYPITHFGLMDANYFKYHATSIQEAAAAAAADNPIGKLPDGYDTMLGKSFTNGYDLSGGEWQRLALARAYWRQAPIMILDEPTSAMDPWAEYEWLQRFRKLAAGYTVLIITHRLSTAMYADVIHVMDRGEIIESGDHQELLLHDGKYAQAWGQLSYSTKDDYYENTNFGM